jgi:tetratricopeptide (TPR) repeat protein
LSSVSIVPTVVVLACLAAVGTGALLYGSAIGGQQIPSTMADERAAVAQSVKQAAEPDADAPNSRDEWERITARRPDAGPGSADGVLAAYGQRHTWGGTASPRLSEEERRYRAEVWIERIDRALATDPGVDDDKRRRLLRIKSNQLGWLGDFDESAATHIELAELAQNERESAIWAARAADSAALARVTGSERWSPTLILSLHERAVAASRARLESATRPRVIQTARQELFAIVSDATIHLRAATSQTKYKLVNGSIQLRRFTESRGHAERLVAHLAACLAEAERLGAHRDELYLSDADFRRRVAKLQFDVARAAALTGDVDAAVDHFREASHRWGGLHIGEPAMLREPTLGFLTAVLDGAPHRFDVAARAVLGPMPWSAERVRLQTTIARWPVMSPGLALELAQQAYERTFIDDTNDAHADADTDADAEATWWRLDGRGSAAAVAGQIARRMGDEDAAERWLRRSLDAFAARRELRSARPGP